MADPFTMFAVASTAVNVGGALMSGSAEYQSAMGDAAIAGENARRSRMSAENARRVGNAAEEAKRREIRKSLGRSAAAVSQSGTGGPSYGSNAALLKQSSQEAELDALNIRYDAESEAYGHQVDALGYEDAKRAARRRARGAKWSTALNVASAALGGYSNYSGMKASRPAPYAKAGGRSSAPTRATSRSGLVAYGGG